jgi:hypothetical protein
MSRGKILCITFYKPKDESQSHKKTRDDSRNDKKSGGGLRKAKSMKKQENKVPD